jgi:flagellar protein FlaJ
MKRRKTKMRSEKGDKGFDFQRLSEDATFEDEDIDPRDKSMQTMLAERFYPLYQVLFSGSDFIERYETKLKESNIGKTSDIYLSESFSIGAVSGGFLGLLAFTIAFALGSGLTAQLLPLAGLPPIPAAIARVIGTGMLIVLGGTLGTIIGTATLGGWALARPYLRARSRGREINLQMPASVAFMYSESAGGMGHLEVFRKMAESEDTYGEFAVEFQRIVRQVDAFNSDFETAVTDVAENTPSDELGKFLIDLNTVINSGGEVGSFLETAKDEQRESRQRKLEDILQTLELSSQVYTPITVLPMLLVIILVIMSYISGPQFYLLYLTVYGVAPLGNILFGALISTAKEDDTGTGLIKVNGEAPGKPSERPLSTGPVEKSRKEGPLFRKMWFNALRHRVREIVTNPLSFVLDYPIYLVVVLVGLNIPIFITLISGQFLTVSFDALTEQLLPTMFAIFYIPMLTIALPYALIYEFKSRTRQSITDTLPTDLRNLANANDTGQPLHEALKIVGKNSDTRVADEYAEIYKKLQLNVPLETSIAEFNNKYAEPQLARMLKIVQQAQQVTTHITDVLETAATAAAYQQRIEKKRKSQLRSQAVITEVAFLIFLGILAWLEVGLVGTLARVTSGSGGFSGAFGSGGIDPGLLGVLFFHLVLIQGVFSGLISGYLMYDDIQRGLPIAIGNATVAFVAWLGITLWF